MFKRFLSAAALVSGQFVLGIEGDMSATDFGDKAIHNVAGDPNIGFPPLKFRADYEMDWFSTIRGSGGRSI